MCYLMNESTVLTVALLCGYGNGRQAPGLRLSSTYAAAVGKSPCPYRRHYQRH